MPPDESQEQSKAEKYQEYCQKESDEAYTTINKNEEEYDKQLLTLSTGLLAVQLAFLKDIVHLDSSVHRWILYCGFASLGFTIVFVLISFQISIHALEEVRNYWKKQYKGDVESEFPDHLGRRIKLINLAGGFSFFSGVACALVFITINLANQPMSGVTNEQQFKDSRRLDGEGTDRPLRTERLEYQGTRPACPEGEHCTYQLSETEEIGGSMKKNETSMQDAALVKHPQIKVTGGSVAKKPITNGSKEKPKP